MPPFDMDFAKKTEDHIVGVIQSTYGCFHCNLGGDLRPNTKKDAKNLKKCTKCGIARYCSKECQVQDWKTNHREQCNNFCENRADGGFCFAECLRGSHFLDERTFQTSMQGRQQAFFQALQTQEQRPNFNLIVTCFEGHDEQVVLAVTVNFIDDDWEMRKIDHLVFEGVDQGQNAVRDINRGTGEISSETLQRVCDRVGNLCREMNQHGQVSSILLGRAIFKHLDNFKAHVEQVLGHNVHVTPDMAYAMRDML
mmetsp:Transcript_76913/g.223333  ORF Transcript_76913/g.223333 Transcript_76913/m.223333 type:complete len:253 (-) Transcript_76913:37-795(-)